jgi:hypothetical protein
LDRFAPVRRWNNINSYDSLIDVKSQDTAVLPLQRQSSCQRDQDSGGLSSSLSSRHLRLIMGIPTRDVNCEVCGNKTANCFEVRLGGKTHLFDSFECALEALATRCGFCNCQIRGHSVVLGDKIYCSYPCANEDSFRQHESDRKRKDQVHL